MTGKFTQNWTKYLGTEGRQCATFGRWQRLTNGRKNAWLKLATKERKPSVLRPFE